MILIGLTSPSFLLFLLFCRSKNYRGDDWHNSILALNWHLNDKITVSTDQAVEAANACQTRLFFGPSSGANIIFPSKALKNMSLLLQYSVILENDIYLVGHEIGKFILRNPIWKENQH